MVTCIMPPLPDRVAEQQHYLVHIRLQPFALTCMIQQHLAQDVS